MNLRCRWEPPWHCCFTRSVASFVRLNTRRGSPWQPMAMTTSHAIPVSTATIGTLLGLLSTTLFKHFVTAVVRPHGTAVFAFLVSFAAAASNQTASLLGTLFSLNGSPLLRRASATLLSVSLLGGCALRPKPSIQLAHPLPIDLTSNDK